MTSRASRSFTRESSESSNRSYTDYDTDSVRRRWRLSPSPRPRSLTTAEVEDILSQDQYTGYTYGDSISYRSDGAEEFLHPYLNQRRHVDFSAGDVSIYRLASGKRAQPTHSDYTRESSFSSWLSSPRVLAKGALRLLLGCLHGLMTFGLITIGLVYSVLHGIGRGFNTWIWPTITSPFNSWRSSEDQNKQSYNAARYGNQQHSIWHDFGSVVAEFLKKTIVWTVWILTLGQIDLSEHFFGKTTQSILASPERSPRASNQHVHFQSPNPVARSFRQTSTPLVEAHSRDSSLSDDEDEPDFNEAVESKWIDGPREVAQRGLELGKSATSSVAPFMRNVYDSILGAWNRNASEKVGRRRSTRLQAHQSPSTIGSVKAWIQHSANESVEFFKRGLLAVYNFFSAISDRAPRFGHSKEPEELQERTYDLRSRSPSTSPIKTRSQRSISRTKTVYRVSPAGKQIWSETRVFKTLGGHGDRAFQGMKRMLVGGANDEPSMLRSGVDKISHLFPIDDEKRAKKVVPLLLFLLLLLGLGIAANRNSRQLKAFAQNSVDFVKDQTYGVYNSIKSNSYAIYEKANQVVSGTRSWIYNSVSGIGNWIDGFFSGFFGRLKQNLNYPQRPDWMNFGLFYKPVEWISDLTNYIYRSVSNFFNSFGSWTSDSISGLYDRVKDIGNAANRNSRQLKTYGQNSVDYVKDQTTGVYNSIASNLYDVYEKTTSYPRNVVDFVKNQSNGVYNSITSNAYAAYEKINQLISGTGSSIYNVFYASGSWISGFIGGFVGRLKYNLGYLQRPDWMNLGLLYKPVELTSDFANYVYQSASNFFHFIYSRTVSMIPERKPVEKVIVHEHHHEYKPEPVTQQPIIQQVIVPTVDTDAIRKLIRESLEQYDADKTGQPDYALETSGAEVIGIGCTKVYEEKSRLQYMFGLPLYYSNYGPRTIIQRKSNSIIPGECFAFEGEHGEVIIKLSRKINVTAISYEHLPLILSPEGHIKTAPKSFLVWSLQDYHKTGENKKHLLGKFTYDDKGSALQTFHTEFPDSQFTPIIQLETESNYGSPVTCLYRFRVHGQPVETH